MIPIGAKSKKLNDVWPRSASMAVAKILGGVPIRVMLPPISEEKASGISSRDRGILACREMPTTAGSRTAVAPMLFIKADILPQVIMITATKRGSLLPARRMIRSPSMSATPVMNKPPETI